MADLAKSIVKAAIRHPDRRLPSYRDWESRIQRARYDCSKARNVLGWHPTDDREEMIRRGINEPATEFFALAPRLEPGSASRPVASPVAVTPH